MAREELKRGEIVIYGSKNSGPKLQVTLENETVWLTQAQMARLFDKDVRTISEHIKNIYEDQELKKWATIRNFRIVQNENRREIERSLEHYNLDVIISVGYRVKSKQGTQFRIWANKILRDYLVRGYAVNEKRLLEQRQAFVELQNAIKFIRNSFGSDLLDGKKDELIQIIDDYADSFSLLYEYDEGKLKLPKGVKGKYLLEHSDCLKIIKELKSELILKKEAADLFGRENGERFAGIIGNIYQSFGGEDLYPTLTGKASHLLYFVIKDHPFFDGNKRIASLLFVYYLSRNNIAGIDKNTLVALALLVAISNPKDKETMIKIIANLIPAN